MNRPLAGRRIGLLTASASRMGGGVFEAVVAQAQIIAAHGGEPIVFALEDEHGADDRARFGSAEVQTFAVRGPRQIGYAPELSSALLAARLDCLHLHGIWMYPSRAGAVWAQNSGKGYIISPHGMLDPWITGRGRWKKTLARVGYERAGWRRATFLHALTAREAADIACESGRSDSMVIANAAPPVLERTEQFRAPHVAYIGRIHPKKNLLELVAAWSKVRRSTHARLIIAGWGDHEAVTALEAAISAADGSVQFVGPVYGDAKREILAHARFIVLPSLSEGLPMAVLEGWAAGTPSIMTRECNLSEGFACGAAIECGAGATGIAAALERALELKPAQWQAMADNALGLAAGPFSAETIAGRWSEAYLRAIAMGDKIGR
jgi:poly(glycerol-phosphate) alpha-glucosyltransferase